MSIERIHDFVALISRVLELGGAAIILIGVVAAAVLFVREGLGSREWRHAYSRLRSNLGRGILLGLELLVAADIINTITAPLTFQSVGLLAIVILMRTFLSFALETEIEGCWPWQRAALERAAADTDKPR